MTFTSPLGLAALISLLAIILLYILKQKRNQLTISSLHLWKKVIMDFEARTPWQKLRKNLLLFLQLLAAAALSLSLAGLTLNSSHPDSSSVVIAIDNSLSMQSRDVSPTRLEAAVKDAMQYIDRLSENSTITIVSLERSAEILLYASTRKNDAKKALLSIKPSFSWLDKDKASALLISLKSRLPESQILLFGDNPILAGNIEIMFSNYEAKRDNASIIRFTHTCASDITFALTVIRNQSVIEKEISVSLYGDESFLDSRLVTVSAGDTENIWWNEIPSSIKKLYCVIDTPDSLMPDNEAWDIVADETSRRILLVSEGNIFLEKVLSLMEGVELVRTLPDDTSKYTGYDLYIFDGNMPLTLPEDGHIMIFAPPSNKYFEAGGWMNNPVVHPVKHNLFKYIENFTFSIGRTRIMNSPQWAETVLESALNPVIFEGVINNSRILVFGFNLYETNLPLCPEFPVLMNNAVSSLIPYEGSNIEGLETADNVIINSEPEAQKILITTPGNESIVLAPPFPPDTFTNTLFPGIYLLEQQGSSQSSIIPFAVNVPDEFIRETGSTEYIVSGEEQQNIIPLSKKGESLTFPLIMLVLIILLIEWWFYGSRYNL